MFRKWIMYVWEARMAKIAFVILTAVHRSIVVKTMEMPPPSPQKERIKIVPMTRDQRKTINRHSHKNREHVLKISEKNLKILKITPPRDNHGA